VAAIDASPRDRDGRTLVEATAGGWWYTALVPGARRVVAYLTDRDLVAPEVRTTDGFAAMLAATDHVRARIGDGTLAGPPAQVAAGTVVLEPAAGDGWLAVGDAALAVDPLSSQGIFNALATGIQAGDAIADAIADALADAIADGTVSAYAARIEEMARTYRAQLADYYAMERRWPDRPFWRRRAHVASRPPV
ncbi:MAG: tryptophan 7-halogenase, partial [Acidimicrobiales bacterium]